MEVFLWNLYTYNLRFRTNFIDAWLHRQMNRVLENTKLKGKSSQNNTEFAERSTLTNIKVIWRLMFNTNWTNVVNSLTLLVLKKIQVGLQFCHRFKCCINTCHRQNRQIDRQPWTLHLQTVLPIFLRSFVGTPSIIAFHLISLVSFLVHDFLLLCRDDTVIPCWVLEWAGRRFPSLVTRRFYSQFRSFFCSTGR